MTNNELFINATRSNYQFPFRGMINVIDLWDLSLTNLDSVFKTLNAEVKKSEEESLLNTKSKEDEEISNKIEIVKYIVGVKLDEKKKREVIITNNETGEAKNYLIPFNSRIKPEIEDGKYIEAGDELTEGSVNPHDILKIKGVRAVQDYILREVQRVYRLQGVDINDKHVEVIVRQMLKKVRIETPGDSEYLPGMTADTLEFNETCEKLLEAGQEPPTATQILLGITKSSLATNSFLSAASFQETTKVLTEAAINGKVDPLIGLKENVIIGKLIPAGTGMKRYRSVKLTTDTVEELNVSEDGEFSLGEDNDDVVVTENLGSEE